MSRWNVERVEAVYAAFARGEFPHDLFEETAEWHTDPMLPRPTAYHGRDEIAAYFERFIGAWHALQAQPVDFEPRPGEQVIVTVRMGPPADGFDPTVAHLWRLRQGKVASVRVYGVRDAACEAAAAADPPRPAAPSLPDRTWQSRRPFRGPAPDPQARFVRDLPHAHEALDIGCGDGRLSVELTANALTLADVSLVALKRARKRLPAATLVLLEPGRRLPFEAETFGLVLMADTIPEVQDVAGLVAEVKRVLQPGGTVAITAPAHGRSTGLAVLRRGFGATFDPRGPELRFFTDRSLRDLLDLAGFQAIAVDCEQGELLASAQR